MVTQNNLYRDIWKRYYKYRVPLLSLDFNIILGGQTYSRFTD